MRFAHLADCHIGAWKEPKLCGISIKAFARTVDICIEKHVDFIVISGDLFNTSLPSLDVLKETVHHLKTLRDSGIPVYAIPGSHDFSASGKTIIDVIENAGLAITVNRGIVTDEGKLRLRFTIDLKTGAKLTGILGRKGMLDRKYYEELDKSNLEAEHGFKIFLLHTAINELKPDAMQAVDAAPLSLLPRHFNYYAAGHVHYVFQKQEKDYGIIAYPGPLFPNSFKELEELHNGGFYIVDVDEANNNAISLVYQPIVIVNVASYEIDCNNKSPEDVFTELKNAIGNREFIDTIVLIRLAGTLAKGKPADINLKEIFSILYGKSAFYVMRNTASLVSKEFEEIKINANSIEQIEEQVLDEHLGQIDAGFSAEEEKVLAKLLLGLFDKEKNDGETKTDFESRIASEAKAILGIKEN